MLERKYRKNNITYDERLNIINILTKKKKKQATHIVVGVK